MRSWWLWEGFAILIVLVIMRQMLLHLWVGGVFIILFLAAIDVVAESCARWYPVVCDLHRFFIAIARSVVNDDGSSGTSLHPVVWSRNSTLKRRVPGSAALWGPLIGIVAYLLLVLVMVISLLGPSLSDFWLRLFIFWGVCTGLGVLVIWCWCGVSYLELLILYEQRAGERLVVECALLLLGVLGVQFQCRLFLLVQALMLGALVVFLGVSFVSLLCFLVVYFGLCLVG